MNTEIIHLIVKGQLTEAQKMINEELDKRRDHLLAAGQANLADSIIPKEA